MITFQCAHCGEMLQMSEASAGKKGQCAKCGNLMDIPMAPPSEIPPLASPYAATASEPMIPGPRTPATNAKSGSSGSVLTHSAMDFGINSIILGGVGFLTSPWIIAVRPAGVFPAILVGLAVLGLGGLGLTLGIFGLLRALDQKMRAFWYVLSGLVLSGLAIVSGLTMFIAAMIR
jgi:hypothetical protein